MLGTSVSKKKHDLDDRKPSTISSRQYPYEDAHSHEKGKLLPAPPSQTESYPQTSTISPGQYPPEDAHSHEKREPPPGPLDQTESYPQTSTINPRQYPHEDAHSYGKRESRPAPDKQIESCPQTRDTMAQREPRTTKSEDGSRLPSTNNNREPRVLRKADPRYSNRVQRREDNSQKGVSSPVALRNLSQKMWADSCEAVVSERLEESFCKDSR